MNLFTIGCDPEFFLKYGDKTISAIGVVGGSKDAPRPIGSGCAVQEDNVAVEFCIPPAESCEQFYNSIMYSLDTIMKELPEGLSFKHTASEVFDDDQLDNPQALEFGCDPDYNAWTGTKNPKPKATDKALRSAGGHVHIGVNDVDPIQLIRAMDLFVGVPSIKLDSDTRRRELYGKAGCYRPKPYGAEYRTLSNFWIWDKKLIEWVYHQTSRAVDFVKQGNKLSVKDGVMIQQCINQADHKTYDFLTHKYAGAF